MRSVLSGTLAATLWLWSIPSAALDLRQAYIEALTNDAQFQAAIKEKSAGLISREIGRAGLLPQLQWTYSNNNNQLQRTSVDNAGRPITDSPDYRSTSNVMSLRQPIVNFEALARYRQGLAQSNQSLAMFDSQANAMAVRLMEAYANVLLSNEQVALLEAESAAYEELMKVNEALWRKGEGTRTDAIETRSRFLVSQAQLAEALGAQDTARRQLEGIIGSNLRNAISTMPALPRSFKPETLSPSSIDSWEVMALEGSPDIRALRHALEVARQDIERARSGHMPRVDLVASLSRTLSETTMTINQRMRNESAGVQVTMPIFSGGAVDAGTRQASANHEKALAQLEARINEVMVDLRKHFNLLMSGVTKIAAFEAAVDSAEKQVMAMRKSIAGGQRVNADLLNAIQQLRVVRRDQAQARYTYLNSWIRLKAHSGVVGEEEIGQLARYFAP